MKIIKIYYIQLSPFAKKASNHAIYSNIHALNTVLLYLACNSCNCEEHQHAQL